MDRDPPLLRGQNVIAASFVEGRGSVFSAFDPTLERPLPPDFREADPGQILEAAAEALGAFGPYRRLPAARRADFLAACAEGIEALGDALLARASAETGLPIARLRGERARTCDQLRAFAALLREGSWVEARLDLADPGRLPSPRPGLRRWLVPVGPVAVFGASNFPLAFSVAGGDTASALAAGCPVVVKAHPAHPGTSELIARALVQALEASGLPRGVFSMLHGGAGVGQALVQTPAIAAVGFTGSRVAGRALFDLAAARPRPIPCFAEMGSVNPVFVLPGALRERAEEIGAGFAASMTLGAGQFCTKPGVLAAVRGEGLDRLLEACTSRLRASPAQPLLTPAIHDRYRAGCLRWSRHPALTALLPPGDAGGGRALPGLWKATARALGDDPELGEELFGPAALVVGCDSAAQMLELCASLHGQLTASVHWSDADLPEVPGWLEAAASISGRVVANGFPTGVEVCPSMQHGGPFPASTDARFTSVGTAAILRWVRPVAFQSVPSGLLPSALQDGNPDGIRRLVDGRPER